MKKSLLFLLAFLLSGSLTLQAGPVSADRALEVAKKALPQPATKASGDLKLIWNGENAATKAAGQPAFYVFGRDAGGFVIIAGDDNVQPVLAISETNRFEVEGMPDNLQWWMDNIKNYVRTTVVQTPEARVQWAKFAETKAPTVEPDDPGLSGKVGHKTPEWNQGNSDNHYFEQQVFNTHCPKDADNNLTLTGCVATALGELLTTMSGLYSTAIVPYPTQPTAPGYEVSAGSVAAAGPGEDYYFSFTGPSSSIPWEQLRTLKDTEAINAAITAGKTELLDNLGKLLADLGAMTQAQYGSDGTGASSEYATTMMAKYMGFNKAARFAYAEDYSLRQWKELLKAQLSRHPVFFSGRKTNSGHAFLLDGYAIYNGADEMFYVNFGWSGSNNGYYLVNQFGEYNQVCAAAIDFYPAPASTYPKIIRMIRESGSNPRDGLSYTDGAPKANGDPVIINKVYIQNQGQETYTGPIRLVAVDKNGEVKQVFQQFPISGGLDPGYYVGLYFPATDGLHIDYDFAFGDKIMLQFTPDGSTWKKIESTLPSCYMVEELPLMPAAFIKTEDEYHVGDYFQFKLINQDVLYIATEWTFTSPDGVRSSPQQQSQFEYELTSSGRYKIEAAIKPLVTSDVVETVVTYIDVQ